MATFTQADLAALEAAYAQGIKKIKAASGKEIEYASMDDMWAAILRLRRSLSSRRYVGGVFSHKRNA